MKSRKAEGPRLRLSIEEVDMIRELRAKKIDNLNENSALTDHLNERGIDKNDVISVKHWQSANGEYRFSIVTKENLGIKEKDILKPTAAQSTGYEYAAYACIPLEGE